MPRHYGTTTTTNGARDASRVPALFFSLLDTSPPTHQRKKEPETCLGPLVSFYFCPTCYEPTQRRKEGPETRLGPLILVFFHTRHNGQRPHEDEKRARNALGPLVLFVRHVTTVPPHYDSGGGTSTSRAPPVSYLHSTTTKPFL